MVTSEHTNSALSSTRLQSTGRSSPITPGLTVPEDSGARIVSHGAMLPDIPRLAPHTSKLRSGPPTSSPGRGPTSSTSTLTAAYDVPSAPGSSRACASDKGVALLPSYVGLAGTTCSYSIGTSGTFSIDISYASCIDSPVTNVPWGVAVGRKELGGDHGDATRAHN
jgi:hypothetical protein